jgi:sulfoxide reductase heme-binding subunit YedZ
MKIQNGIQPAYLEKWRLLGLISAILVMLAIAIIALEPNVEGVRMTIRVTARTSLLLFLLAFTATAAGKHFSHPWARWQKRNRRYLGLGFVISHIVHAIGIASYAVLYPVQFHAHIGNGSLLPNYIAYVFIVLLALTSFDRTAAWVGPRRWKILHTAGIYYLWISFMVGFGKRIPQSGWYALPLLVLAAALTFRLWPVSKAPSGQSLTRGS